MRLQTLVATMYQKDHSLLDKMNIQSDAIVINQCDKNLIEEFEYKGYKIQWYSLNERGVGLSRNTALMRADADILLFADEDLVYEDGYADKVLDCFDRNPNVALATFNIKSLNSERPEHFDKINHKLYWFNCLKYGACKVAVRREAINSANIAFSLLFGGGAKYQAGEDNVFITTCIKKGLYALATNILIGTVKQEGSTWFKGYDSKYYHDRGALFCAMYGLHAKPMIVLIEIENMLRKTDLSLMQRVTAEFKGVDEYRRMKR